MPLSKQPKLRASDTIPFFARLSSEEFSDLQKIVIKRSFLKNEVILHEEETPNYMYIIYSGKVKAIQTSMDGREHILAIHKRGDFFGEMTMLDGKTSPATIIAIEDSEIGLIKKHDFERLISRDGVLLRQIIPTLCSRLRDAWLMLKVLSLSDAEERVRAVLNHIGTQYGVRENRGMFINIRLTHKDIADYASLSRETVTRIIDRLMKEKEIEIVDRKYLLIKSPFLEKSHSM